MNIDMKSLSDVMGQLLTVESDLCAWQKRDGTEAGVFEIMVKFTKEGYLKAQSYMLFSVCFNSLLDRSSSSSY